MNKLRAGVDTQCFTMHNLPDQDWATRVAQPEYLMMMPFSVTVTSTHFCMVEARLLLEGEEILMALQYDKVPGADFRDKRRYLLAAPQKDVTRMVKDGGFIVKNAATDPRLCVIPSGFVVIVASRGASIVRWAVSADAQDSERVCDTIRAMMETFPESKAESSGFPQLLGFLDNNLSAAQPGMPWHLVAMK